LEVFDFPCIKTNSTHSSVVNFTGTTYLERLREKYISVLQQ
jgi:hypothetical protein